MNILFSLKKIFNPKALLHSSGEAIAMRNVLSKITEKKIVFFDIGGNEGNFSKEVLKIVQDQSKEVSLHVFEPQPKCLEILKKVFQNDARVIINSVALSNEKGEATFYTNYDGSTWGSLVKREKWGVVNPTVVPTDTLDNYLAQHAIQKIDYVKIDVEGNEMKILKGAKESISKKIIKNIQFEYGGTFQDANSTLKEVFDFLLPFYAIYKIADDGTMIVKETFTNDMEDYKYSNFIGILK